MASTIMASEPLLKKVRLLLEACKTQRIMLTAAESCTGGLIAALLTEIPGSSEVFERGFVTYSNEAKTQMLGVPALRITRYGAVSAEVAKAMAEGALKHSNADLAVAVTGIAGPGGGSLEKPVGLVYIAAMMKKNIMVESFRFKGSRSVIRHAAVRSAFAMLGDFL